MSSLNRLFMNLHQEKMFQKMKRQFYSHIERCVLIYPTSLGAAHEKKHKFKVSQMIQSIYFLFLLHPSLRKKRCAAFITICSSYMGKCMINLALLMNNLSIECNRFVLIKEMNFPIKYK